MFSVELVDEFAVQYAACPEGASVFHFGAAFRTRQVTEGLVAYLSVHTAKTVQYVTRIF